MKPDVRTISDAMELFLFPALSSDDLPHISGPRATINSGSIENDFVFSPTHNTFLGKLEPSIAIVSGLDCYAFFASVERKKPEQNSLGKEGDRAENMRHARMKL